jgi:hypothetical protein
MADSYQAVGAMVAPIKSPDTFGQLSNILGIQQQRTALQNQALELQQNQIKTQAAQDNNEYFSSFDPTQYVTPNGTTDVTKIMASDPNYQKLTGAGKVQVTQNLQAIQAKQLTNMSAMATMDNETVGAFGQTMGALATDKDVLADNADGRSKAQAAAQAFALRNPEAAKISGIYSPAFQLQQNGGAKQDHLGPAIQAIAAQAQTVSQQQAQSNPQDITNAQGQHINRAPGTGAISAAPGSTPAINPPSSTVAANTKSGVGLADLDNQRASQISDSVAPSRAVISLTQQLDNYVDQSRTGKFSKAVTDYAAAAGIKDPAIAARQLASKVAMQIKTQATANAPSNEARETISAGSPDPDTMGPEAIHSANELVRGNMKLNLARDANASRFQATHNGTQGLRLADDQLTRNADGLMYEYQSLPAGAQRQDFLARHFKNDPAGVVDFVQRKNLVQHNGGFQQ